LSAAGGGHAPICGKAIGIRRWLAACTDGVGVMVGAVGGAPGPAAGGGPRGCRAGSASARILTRTVGRQSAGRGRHSRGGAHSCSRETARGWAVSGGGRRGAPGPRGGRLQTGVAWTRLGGHQARCLGQPCYCSLANIQLAKARGVSGRGRCGRRRSRGAPGRSCPNRSQGRRRCGRAIHARLAPGRHLH
jgi:hypothetical protein